MTENGWECLNLAREDFVVKLGAIVGRTGNAARCSLNVLPENS